MKTAVILARGLFTDRRGKTAHGLIRYGKRYRIVEVVDETHTGKDAGALLGLGELGIPIVDTVHPVAETLIIGVAPPGGRLPEGWRKDVVKAIESGMDIVSGMHEFLADDPELSKLAEKHDVRFWDVRRPPPASELEIARGERVEIPVVLTCGTDSSVGKRTATLEMVRAAERRGIDAGFVATGQTGIMIGCDAGIVVDALPGDFISGAVEAMVSKVAGGGKEIVFVEGQGALTHVAYASVALGVLHGAMPDFVVMVHDPSRRYRGTFPWLKIPPIEHEIDLVEKLTEHRSKVIGLALNLHRSPEDEWEGVLRSYERRTGLPAVDVLRQKDGADRLVECILSAVSNLPKT